MKVFLLFTLTVFANVHSSYLFSQDLVEFGESNHFPNYTIYDYGKDCYEAMDKVEVPTINCLDGSLLKVYHQAEEVTDHDPQNCDQTGHLGIPFLACVPGTRVQKIVNGDVTTMAICRRLPLGGQGSTLWPLDDPRMNNVAILQFNKKNKNVCWFQIRKHDEKGLDGANVISPYQVDRIKRGQEDLQAQQLYEAPGLIASDLENACIKCHDSHIFIKPPLIAQLYDRNEVPRNRTSLWHGKLHHVGKAFKKWNTQEFQPYRIRVNKQKYDEKFPLTRQQTELEKKGLLADSNECTSCHSIGDSPLVDEDSWEGTCNGIIKEWTHYKQSSKGPMAIRRSSLGNSLKHFAWMPPDAHFDFNSINDWYEYYQRSLEALKYCCDRTNRNEKGEICLAPFPRGQTR